MKFLVAPQLMMVVVLIIFVLMRSFMEICIVLLFGSAISTWLGLQEDDIEATSPFKNPLHQM